MCCHLVVVVDVKVVVSWWLQLTKSGTLFNVAEIVSVAFALLDVTVLVVVVVGNDE